MRIVSDPTQTGVAPSICAAVEDILTATTEDLVQQWLDVYEPLITDEICQAETVKVTHYYRLGGSITDYGRPLAMLKGAVTYHTYVLFLDISGNVPRVQCYQVSPDFVEIDLEANQFTAVS